MGNLDDAGIVHLRVGLEVVSRLASEGHLLGGANAATLCSVAWLFWHIASPILDEDKRTSLLAAAGPGVNFLDGDWQRALQLAADNFGCHWGFSNRLPAGFFRALEASSDPEAQRLVHVSRVRFGRFYP